MIDMMIDSIFAAMRGAPGSSRLKLEVNTVAAASSATVKHRHGGQRIAELFMSGRPERLQIAGTRYLLVEYHDVVRPAM